MRLIWTLLLCLPILAAWQPAAADSRQAELHELRGRIQALQRELEKASEERGEAADALRQSERRISDLNRSLRGLAAQQEALTASLRQLARDSVAARGELHRQQARLAELMRHRYMHGDQDTLRLMLSGGSPTATARNLEYYGYIARARSALIRDYQATLARMQALEAEARDKQAGLERVRQQRVAQKKGLEAEKTSRQEVLFRLSAQIRQQRNEIRTLVQDERRLSQLIERLARLAAARKAERPPRPTRPPKPGEQVEHVADASLAGLNFARLRGRLALPVAGEIRHRFGQSRPGGGPAWKGLFIRARQGEDVRAVGTGKVAFADWLRGFGNLLIIDHGDGYLSLYSNNESLYKQPGDRVRAGDVVASVGASGGQDEPGLYFELRHQGQPFDPMTWVR